MLWKIYGFLEGRRKRGDRHERPYLEALLVAEVPIIHFSGTFLSDLDSTERALGGYSLLEQCRTEVDLRVSHIIDL